MTIPFLLTILLIYLGIMSVISVIVCCYDKVISKRNRVSLRVPERTLLLLSALGGAVAMYLCMLIIRHKTLHKKFMVGLPLIILAHIAILVFLFYFGILTF